MHEVRIERRMVRDLARRRKSRNKLGWRAIEGVGAKHPTWI